LTWLKANAAAVTEEVVTEVAVDLLVVATEEATVVVDHHTVVATEVAIVEVDHHPVVAIVVVDHLAEAPASSFVAWTPTATGCSTQKNPKVAPRCSWIASWARYRASI
jgi:hypothetical protein